VGGGTAGTAGSAAGAGGSGKSAFVIEALTAAPIAVTNNDRVVVWLDASNVHSCAIEGCAGDSVLNIDTLYSPVAGQLAMDAKYVYWMEGKGATIYRCPFTRCVLTNEQFQLYQNPGGNGYTGIGSNSAGFYYGDYETVSCSGGACNGTAYRPDDYSMTFLVDSTGTYVSFNDEAQGVFYSPIGSTSTILSGSPILSPTVLSGSGIKANAGALYFSSGTTITSCPAAGCNNLPFTVVSNAGGIVDFAADSKNLYWIAGDSASTGKIQVCSLPSCTGGPSTVVTGQSNPSFLQVSDHYIMWVNHPTSGTSGTLMGWTK
jgi:hypothetical protein